MNLQVLFGGVTDDRLERSISEYCVESYVKVQPPVPHRKAIEIMTRFHCCFPSKQREEEVTSRFQPSFMSTWAPKTKFFAWGQKKVKWLV